MRAYPRDLALLVRGRWQSGEVSKNRDSDPLPEPSVLEHLISVCFQSSLLREEDRPVRFRLIYRAPDRFPSDQGPPAGLHRLLFKDILPFTERELRKLSPSVDFYSSLIGVWLDEKSGLAIWGIVHSGPRWTQSLYGGGKLFQPLPESLVISVTNPGRITVSKGSADIATLNSGRIVSPSVAVSDSKWVRSAFDSLADEELALHRQARKLATKLWASIDPEFFRTMRKQVLMRIIGRVRAHRHGGTLIIIPDERIDEFLTPNPYAKFKYRFVSEEPRRRFRTLILKIANELAESYGSHENPERIVGWTEYLTSKNQTLSRLDESLFEWAHLVADMAQVDGAVTISQRLELIGFGAQISGKLERVDEVAEALDAEGIEIRKDRADSVGTRHHSAYSLCNELHDVLTVVVSQDGTAQLVKWNVNMVTIWEQLLPSLIEA
jgi:hypothetical protein